MLHTGQRNHGLCVHLHIKWVNFFWFKDAYLKEIHLFLSERDWSHIQCNHLGISSVKIYWPPLLKQELRRSERWKIGSYSWGLYYPTRKKYMCESSYIQYDKINCILLAVDRRNSLCLRGRHFCGQYPLTVNFFFFFQTWLYLFILFIYLFYFGGRLITLQYCSGFCHILTWISHGFTCVPHPEPLPPPSPSHPSGSSQCTSPEHPVSCIEPGQWTFNRYIHMGRSVLATPKSQRRM